MRYRAFLLTASTTIGAALALSGCFSEDTSCEQAGTCGGTGATGGASGAGGDSGLGGSSGTSGTGGSGGDGGTCDTTKSPSEESCLVADEYAIFVSPSGSDSADGTKSAPVQSWEKALTLGNAAGKIVIACNDDFTSPVSLTSAHSGTKLYGGFKCSDWSYDSAKKTKLAPAAGGVALSLDGVVGFHAEDVIVEAKDATTAGASSIAMFANSSSGLTLARVDLKAGKGADGAKGTAAPFAYPKQTDLNGNDASGTTGGGLKTWNCPGGTQTIGGLGGSAVPGGQSGTAGQPPLGAGEGGVAGGNCVAGLGKDGATPPATPAASGATTLGTLSSSGWTPASGTDGATGSPGQGGGGGASDANFGGGGGGAGGCGGAGGPGGKGGGASIALLLLDTPITLDSTVTLTTSAAGKGGDGAAGQAGQPIFGFKGSDAGGTACAGGAGAPGADGGAGGGAAGGISAAVVWKGAAAPSVDTGTKVTLGTKGGKGIGGKAGSNDGIDGVAQDVVEAK